MTDLPPSFPRRPAPGAPPPHWLVPAVLTALAYVLAGKLALLLAVPPSYAAPIYPSAGIALAAVLMHGRAALLGVAAGAFLVNLPLGDARALTSLSAGVASLANGLGAMLQAALGVWLIRRQLPGPLRLAEPREVALFCLLGAVVACLVNASLSVPVLVALGTVPASAVPFTWWTWWAGDTLGVLIGAPITLTVFGRPRADWIGRRITVALPLLASTALLAVATVLVARWDQQRSQSVFERDASAVAAAIEAQLRHASLALEALRGLMVGSDDVSPAELRRAAEPWLALPIQLQALGVSWRVARQDVPAFEAAAVDDRTCVDVEGWWAPLRRRDLHARDDPGAESMVRIRNEEHGDEARAARISGRRHGVEHADVGRRLHPHRAALEGEAPHLQPRPRRRAQRRAAVRSGQFSTSAADDVAFPAYRASDRVRT
mgnify:CR=1 FL=1